MSQSLRVGLARWKRGKLFSTTLLAIVERESRSSIGAEIWVCERKAGFVNCLRWLERIKDEGRVPRTSEELLKALRSVLWEAHPDVLCEARQLDRWYKGEVSTEDLLRGGFETKLRKVVARLKLHSRDQLLEALDEVRVSPTALTSQELQKQVRVAVWRNRRASLLVQIEPLDADDKAYAHKTPSHGATIRTSEPSNEVKAQLRKELGDLAFFASLPDTLPASVVPIARILTLRIFAGWSLERIAEHDRQSMSDVCELWDQARTWLSSEAGEASTVGSLIHLPLPDGVIEAVCDSPQLLHVTGWRAFERILAKLLEVMEYEIELQRGTKDGGIDIIAVKNTSAFGLHRYLLQAKRTGRAVGVKPVRELLFLKNEYRATKACLATTSSFTAGALRLEQDHRWELELRDFDRLRQWLELANKK